MAVAEVLEKDTAVEMGADWVCPICGTDPQFNDETIEAIEECRAMREGKIQGQRYKSLDKLFESLHNQDA